jgi:murein DD-endopeptidase MepM/ murein hydrolase activator NlpD
MKRRTRRASWLPLFLVAIFFAGGATGWWARARTAAPSQATLLNPPSVPDTSSGVKPTDVPRSVPTTGEITPPLPETVVDPNVISALRSAHLQLPIDNATVEALRGQFGDARDGGARGHEAVDIMAPRNTPIHAVDAGTIAKLFQSRAGGTTIYQFDPSQRFCYYYAHLQAYAPGLHEGQQISRGEVIGFVGTSGNAPPNAPHLHFAIFELNASRHWWEGTAIDPYPAFTH